MIERVREVVALDGGAHRTDDEIRLATASRRRIWPTRRGATGLELEAVRAHR